VKGTDGGAIARKGIVKEHCLLQVISMTSSCVSSTSLLVMTRAALEADHSSEGIETCGMRGGHERYHHAEPGSSIEWGWELLLASLVELFSCLCPCIRSSFDFSSVHGVLALAVTMPLVSVKSVAPFGSVFVLPCLSACELYTLSGDE